MKTKKSNYPKFGLFNLENGVLEIKEVLGQDYLHSWNLLIMGLKEEISKKEVSKINITWQTIDASNSANFCWIMGILKKANEKLIVNWDFSLGKEDVFQFGTFLKVLYPDLNILEE